MFIIPQTCHNWGREIPPVGTRVSFHVVTDGRTGRPRADGVEPANDEVLDEAQAAQEALVDELLRGPLAPSPPMDAQHGAPPGPSIGRCEGVVQCERGTFGFIKQDNGESDMFVLPPVPPVGARVAYDVVQDPKTGRPRAENVQVLSAAGAPARGSFVSASPALRAPPIAQRRPAGAGSYGAAQEMSLDEVMDSMSGMSWDQMQDLTYEDIAGRSEEHAAPQPPAAHGGATGTVASINASGTFGFIAQDSGEADMFALPPVPPVGTRVSYDVVQDAKTGRPRAENVTCSGAGAGIGTWGGRGGA
uniref:Cold-shock domain-containing protein n=1 Tax=Zooxanthella nutricula TaxID=1333877 RepID=A0A7S2VRV1_9DINO